MLLALLILLQEPAVAGQAVPDPPAVSVDRIRRALDRDRARFEPPPPDRRIFRVFINQQKPIEFPVMWKDTVFRPPRIRPSLPIGHYEFLAKVTPEDFRSPTTLPVGVPVHTIVIAVNKAIARDKRTRAEQRAREQVQRELRELEAARAAARR